jgi:hypothetical protein
MSKASDLRDKFEAKLKLLQDNCPHKETQVMQYMWAPGHFGGHVEVCKECEKIIRHIPDLPQTPEDLQVRNYNTEDLPVYNESIKLTEEK